MVYSSFGLATEETCYEDNLSSLTNRGSVTKTPFITPENMGIFSAGYNSEYFKSASSAQNFIQPVAFLGLPHQSEIIVGLPDYNQIPGDHLSGASATEIALRKQIGCMKKLISAAEINVTVPSGSYAFGSPGVGVNISGLVQYKINHELSLGSEIGLSSITAPGIFGGSRFLSLNPSLVLSYAPNEKTSVFAEIFGSTKTSPKEGGNVNMDYGIFYLVSKDCLLDFEFGHQLSQVQVVFNYFFNTGFSLKF